MSKLKIVGNDGGIGTFTIISPNSNADATIELPHSGGTLVTNSQDLIPNQDEVYDLGSSSKAFKDLHISASTIFLGTQPIRATSSGIVVPEIQIGEGISAVKLKASDDGKLKQTSTTVDGIETPEINIPEKLIDLLDIRDTAPTQNDKTLVWSDATSKFEFLTVPEVFSDFTDVDTVTTPPTDTQVLTWNETNNEWSAGNNGFPLTVANTTELLALTGMLVGQEAFVVDLNRSYTYTGSAPNDNWRHAVSGWYATDDIMTNHPPTTITGAPSAATVNNLIPTTFNLSTDDPDEKPVTFLHTFENLTGTFLPGVIDDLVTITDNNGNITITNNQNIDSGAGVGSNTFNVKFTVLDDSLYAVEGVESTTQISRPNLPGGIPNWENNTSWSTGIRMPGSSSGGQHWTHMEGWNTTASWQIPKDPITDVEWTWPHPYNSMQNLYGSQHQPQQADEVFFFGQSVDLDASGNVLAISDPANNRVHIYNYYGTEWIKNQSNIISQYPTGYPDTSNPPAPPIGTYGGIIDGEYLTYGKNQIALSDDGNTLAVTAMDSTDGSGSPYVEIWTHTNNIWSSQQKLYPFSDMPSLPQTAIGMSVSLSSTGDTVVVGYRLAGQTIYQGSQFTTGDVHEYSNGQVYIYERNSDTNIWNTGFRVQGMYAGGSLGAAVDISGDGMYVAMSAPNAVNGPDTGESHGGVADGGYVLIYKKNPAIGWNSPIVADTWLLEKTIRPPVADQKVNNRFGFNSISLSFNGQHLAVGDIGQALTAVRETQGTGVMHRVLNYNYMTGTDHTFPNGIVYMYKKVSDNWTFDQYVENGSGTKDDGFGDRVSLSFNGKLLSVGAIYENTGFGFPYTLIGNTTFHDYSAKKVFNDWYRFSHSGVNQPAFPHELNAWNYTEATEAINCTVNSSSYIGFVTPPDGKATQYDLRVSFTSANEWDNDMISIVIAFTTDANGKEHTISLIRSGGHIGYVYAIVYNYAQPDVQVIWDGVSLINDLAFVWGSTVAATGEGQFVRNRITRIGDQFTVTTSQLLHPNSHTGTDSDLDSSTTKTFNLANYSFGSLFSVANDGARWGFSCQSQDLSSWVNVDLRDAVNPDLIEDTGAVHVFELDSDVPSFTKRKRLLPVISNDPTSERYDPTYAGYSHLTSTSNHHMHNAPISAMGSTITSGTRLSSNASQVNVWKTTYDDNPPTPIYLAAPSTGVTTIGGPAGNTYIDYENNTSTTITAISTDPEGGSITWSYTTSGNMGSTTITNTGDGTFTFFTPAHAIEHNFAISIIATDSSDQASAYSMNYVWEYPVVSPNSAVFYESEFGGENGTSSGTESGTNYTWTCPSDVYFVHALCVGGGGHLYQGGITKGGGGGGLGWKNNIPVVPGQSYNLRVGRGGHTIYQGVPIGGNADSWFINSVTVQGQGGYGSITGGGYIGDGGGKGGDGSLLTYADGGLTPNGTSGAGGGAGGYGGPARDTAGQSYAPGASAGYGGDASQSSGLSADSNAFGASNGSDGAGGGGGGGSMNSSQIGYAGGGVGINGQGNSGAGGVLGSGTSGSGGKAGSGGQDGGLSGGDFGGGGSGRNPGSGDGGGGDGVVKLIWGTGEDAPLWPSTNIPQTNPQFQTDAQKGI